MQNRHLEQLQEAAELAERINALEVLTVSIEIASIGIQVITRSPPCSDGDCKKVFYERQRVCSYEEVHECAFNLLTHMIRVGCREVLEPIDKMLPPCTRDMLVALLT